MNDYDKLINHLINEWQTIWFKFATEFAKSKNYNKFDDTWFHTNPHITLNIIENNPQYQWNYNWLGYNQNITMDFILKNLDKPWNWKFNLTTHFCIAMEHVLNHPELPWNFDMLGVNPNITTKNISENPQIKWKWIVIGNQNRNLTMDFILENYEKLCAEETLIKYGYPKGSKGSKNRILWNDTITMDFVLEHSDYNWDFSRMCNSDIVTEDFIKKYPIVQSAWSNLVMNKNISMEFIFENLDKIQLRHNIHRNPNLTMEFILKHPEFAWKNYEIGSNENITIQFMLEHPEFETRNTNVQPFYVVDEHFQVIEDTSPPIMEWLLTGTSKNPNLSMKFVLDNPDLPWLVGELLLNQFTTDYVAHVRNKIGWLFLVTVHEQIENDTTQHFTDLEQILFDDYILKMIVKY